MENFTPLSALIGGGLIGLASGLYLILNGRIAGISGIVGTLLTPNGSERWEKLAFVAGLIIGPLLIIALPGFALESVVRASWPVIILGGILVGFGTRLGSGCTSGHGICGLSRMSARSLMATLAFMTAGFVTVFILRHLIGA
ncbi:YeeE/YedE family protein [Thalassospira sp.]|uniref:YeeE/YedE family protein n=1 Tax=Thalassospira sp. TaxID=1912094 RepID=UPI00273631D2|nr:YeeE/YedE family protein [Thalassospira sp.]MDP2700415.1 YeeE/YedE family protein [Thalassospira sp.]